MVRPGSEGRTIQFQRPFSEQLVLTHWGPVNHLCVSKLTIIASDNSLSPGRCQAIVWTNAGISVILPLGTKFSEIVIKIYTFSRKCICNYRLKSVRHFVPASMCKMDDVMFVSVHAVGVSCRSDSSFCLSATCPLSISIHTMVSINISCIRRNVWHQMPFLNFQTNVIRLPLTAIKSGLFFFVFVLWQY